MGHLDLLTKYAVCECGDELLVHSFCEPKRISRFILHTLQHKKILLVVSDHIISLLPGLVHFDRSSPANTFNEIKSIIDLLSSALIRIDRHNNKITILRHNHENQIVHFPQQSSKCQLKQQQILGKLSRVKSWLSRLVIQSVVAPEDTQAGYDSMESSSKSISRAKSRLQLRIASSEPLIMICRLLYPGISEESLKKNSLLLLKTILFKQMDIQRREIKPFTMEECRKNIDDACMKLQNLELEIYNLLLNARKIKQQKLQTDGVILLARKQADLENFNNCNKVNENRENRIFSWVKQGLDLDMISNNNSLPVSAVSQFACLKIREVPLHQRLHLQVHKGMNQKANLARRPLRLYDFCQKYVKYSQIKIRSKQAVKKRAFNQNWRHRYYVHKTLRAIIDDVQIVLQNQKYQNNSVCTIHKYVSVLRPLNKFQTASSSAKLKAYFRSFLEFSRYYNEQRTAHQLLCTAKVQRSIRRYLSHTRIRNEMQSSFQQERSQLRRKSQQQSRLVVKYLNDLLNSNSTSIKRNPFNKVCTQLEVLEFESIIHNPDTLFSVANTLGFLKEVSSCMRSHEQVTNICMNDFSISIQTNSAIYMHGFSEGQNRLTQLHNIPVLAQYDEIQSIITSRSGYTLGVSKSRYLLLPIKKEYEIRLQKAKAFPYKVRKVVSNDKFSGCLTESDSVFIWQSTFQPKLEMENLPQPCSVLDICATFEHILILRSDKVLLDQTNTVVFGQTTQSSAIQPLSLLTIKSTYQCLTILKRLHFGGLVPQMPLKEMKQVVKCLASHNDFSGNKSAPLYEVPYVRHLAPKFYHMHMVQPNSAADLCKRQQRISNKENLGKQEINLLEESTASQQQTLSKANELSKSSTLDLTFGEVDQSFTELF